MFDNVNFIFWGLSGIFFLLGLICPKAISGTYFFRGQKVMPELASSVLFFCIGLIVEFVASVVKLDCDSAAVLKGFDHAGCYAHSDSIFTLADVLTSTLGINPVFFTAILLLVLAIMSYIFKLFNNKK